LNNNKLNIKNNHSIRHTICLAQIGPNSINPEWLRQVICIQYSGYRPLFFRFLIHKSYFLQDNFYFNEYHQNLIFLSDLPDCFCSH